MRSYHRQQLCKIPSADSLGAQGTTVCTRHTALTLLQAAVLGWSHTRNTEKSLLGVTALWGGGLLGQNLVGQSTTRGSDHAVLVGTGVPADMAAVSLTSNHFVDAQPSSTVEDLSPC